MTSPPDAVALILGSAFALEGLPALEPIDVPTSFGTHRVWRALNTPRPAYVLFRHGLPHRLLPSQIPYRAQAAALHALDVRALVVTTSVGVLDPELPLFTPMLTGDLLMPENRLPDGSACTMFVHPSADHGHLVLEEGLFSQALGSQIREIAERAKVAMAPQTPTFAYVGGPRTKTRAENRWFAALGAQVNSMTLAPEVILANELEIPCAGLMVGHKLSGAQANPDAPGIEASLVSSRAAMEALVSACLMSLSPVPFANHIYRF